MPLSDKERKVLEELELGLAAEDPRLAQELSSGSVANRFRASTYFAAMACLIGVVLLMAGIGSQMIIIGVAGFLTMGTGAYFLVGGNADQITQPPINPPRVRGAEER